MNSYDDIVEVNKSNTDEIVEVNKFNPFHDANGKFSNKNGFKSYSANPKTRAGAMAIQRSAAAGHGRTMNVHRESKGESISQNDRWLKTGQKPRVPAAVSRARYQQRKQRLAGNAKPTPTGRTTQQGNAKPTPTGRTTQQQKPTQQNQQGKVTQQNQQNTLAASVQNVKLNSGQKLALQSRDMSGQATNTKIVAVDHDQSRVAGKDISKTFDIRKMNTSKAPIDAIAEAQGWNKGATVTNDKDLFDKAAVQAGRVMMRSVNSYPGTTAQQVCNKTMSDGNYPLGGHGGKVYGSGMYVVDTSIKGSTSTRNMAQNVAAGQSESFCYGNKQMMATVHPNAKIATATQTAKMYQDFYNLSSREKARFGNDRNTYIASKGFDGAKHHRDSDPSAYTTVFNKSALIFYGSTADAY